MFKRVPTIAAAALVAAAFAVPAFAHSASSMSRDAMTHVPRWSGPTRAYVTAAGMALGLIAVWVALVRFVA